MKSAPLPPYKIRKLLLDALRDLLKKLNSAECLVRLYDASDEEIAKWAHAMIEARRLRDMLEKAELSEIRDQLIRNEEKIKTGAAALYHAGINLGKIKPMLDAAKVFLEIIKTALLFV